MHRTGSQPAGQSITMQTITLTFHHVADNYNFTFRYFTYQHWLLVKCWIILK